MNVLLKFCKLSKSTYFDVLKNGEKRKHKDDEIVELIRTIFDSHYKKYGYPRITIELNNRGYKINEKRVARLMKLHHIRAVPRKTKYNS